MEILVLDIETTGFLNQNGLIVEIGIVKLDTTTGSIEPLFDAVVQEPGFGIQHTTGRMGWIFKNSDLSFTEVESANSLELYRNELQAMFDTYPATAFNKKFDFDFLKDRGFILTELPCIMLSACPIVNLPPNPGFRTPKWPKVEEAWEFFFGNTGYIEKHRGLDDAIHEAKIAYELINRGALKI